mgnify:CR=1 FL=1
MQRAIDRRVAITAIESQVIRVIDGDTIVVALDHKPETIRLIGINTPETVAPNRPVQCFGPEASTYLKNLLADRVVQLETDDSQDNRDKYNRFLRYVFLPNSLPLQAMPAGRHGGVRGGRDEIHINQLLVEQGYAREYTFNKKNPYNYQAEFRAAQKLAKKNKLGLWGTCK